MTSIRVKNVRLSYPDIARPSYKDEPFIIPWNRFDDGVTAYAKNPGRAPPEFVLKGFGKMTAKEKITFKNGWDAARLRHMRSFEEFVGLQSLVDAPRRTPEQLKTYRARIAVLMETYPDFPRRFVRYQFRDSLKKDPLS